MDYIDFNLEISEHDEENYLIKVRSLSGEAEAIGQFPLAASELETSLQKIEDAIPNSAIRRRKAQTPEEETVQQFGQILFDAHLRDLFC